MSDLSHPPPVPRWLRFWAVFTVVAALPLVMLGAEVTTKKVGMVDQVGFRAPWHLFTLPSDQLSLGMLIEHGHRLAGFVVGFCCIVLAIGLTIAARGWLHRSLGWIALLAVSSQGILGIYRVNRHVEMGPDLALLHGCLAQLVFAVLLAVAVLCSRTWSVPAVTPAGLRVAGVVLAGLVYVQVVFGAVTRHLMGPLAQRLHILLAFVVIGLVFMLLGRLRREGGNLAARRLAVLLAVLVLVQPVLGVEAWVRRFGAGTLPELVQSSPTLDLVRSGHHILGTLIFAATVALAVLLCRPAAAAPPTQEATGQQPSWSESEKADETVLIEPEGRP
jgi:cytochrome c oxidase assembly protein subunit 15